MSTTTEKLGLLEEEVRFVKKDDELINRILKARNWGEEKRQYVTDCLRYNMFTEKQFCDISGVKRPNVVFYTNPQYVDGVLDTKLDYCFPFKSLDTNGPKFIVRNVKSEKYLGV